MLERNKSGDGRRLWAWHRRTDRPQLHGPSETRKFGWKLIRLCESDLERLWKCDTGRQGSRNCPCGRGADPARRGRRKGRREREGGGMLCRGRPPQFEA